jgi:pilus assembly protein Flp/PilA
MNSLKQLVCKFVSDEQGATAIEYGLLAGLISVVIIASVTLIGSNLKGVFDVIVTKLTAIPRT